MKARTVDKQLYDEYKQGKITLHEAARQFHSHGWTNFVDEDFTKRTFKKIDYDTK